MATLDLRKALNAISDVVINRPRPLREFDQIFMKSADLLLQADLISQSFRDKNVVFIGDGDAAALCAVHLANQELFEHGPRHVHVVDFDERVVASVQDFARRHNIADKASAELYNVADRLPEPLWRAFDAFYTNPPFGQRNDGRSIEAFIRRGIEATNNESTGCIVLADDRNYRWTHEVLATTQRLVLEQGYFISHLLPEFHQYHLDDTPDLKSCSMFIQRLDAASAKYASEPLEHEMLEQFYGSDNPLRVRYVRDTTAGGRLGSRDYRFEPLSEHV